MKAYMKGMFLFLIALGLAGCGGKAATPVDIPTSPDEKLIWSSEPKRPGWTLEEPATEKGIMSFVGLSGNYATEQQGRDDAQRNAVNRVVNYTGTLVKDKVEKARLSYGLDS